LSPLRMTRCTSSSSASPLPYTTDSRRTSTSLPRAVSLMARKRPSLRPTRIESRSRPRKDTSWHPSCTHVGSSHRLRWERVVLRDETGSSSALTTLHQPKRGQRRAPKLQPHLKASVHRRDRDRDREPRASIGPPKDSLIIAAQGHRARSQQYTQARSSPRSNISAASQGLRS
jgi:hypothetical protein